MFDLDAYVHAGASGFLLKDTPGRLARRDQNPRGWRGAAGPARDPPPHRRVLPRSTRELEVLALVAHGLSNAEIAAHLQLGKGIVKTHVGHLLVKLAVRDRVQLVTVAYETGMSTPARRVRHSLLLLDHLAQSLAGVGS